MLQELGALLQRNIRGEDIACRYGGEEFLLILPDSSLENTGHRAEEVRRKAEKLQIVYQDKNLNVTISVGVATLPHHGSEVKDVVNIADSCLYQAKKGGRNQVVIAP